MNKLMWRIASNIEPAAESLYRAGTPGKWKISWELNRSLTRVATAGVDHRSEFCMQPAAGCTWTPGSMAATEIADVGAKLFLTLGTASWSRDSVPDQHSVSPLMAERIRDAEMRGEKAPSRGGH